MAEIPGCNDGELDLLKKILLQFRSMATSPTDNTLPSCSDDMTDLYRKILTVFLFI